MLKRLFIEYHHDFDPTFGTAKPHEEIGPCPDVGKGIEAINSQPTFYCPNYKHKRKVEMDKAAVVKYTCGLCGAVVLLFE